MTAHRGVAWVGLLAVWAGLPPVLPNTVVTVRVLVKSESKSPAGVAITEWLPGSGYFVKVGDAQNPTRYCNTLHLDPPARVECAVPSGAQVFIRVDRPAFGAQCPEPFPTAKGVPLSVTARVDPGRRAVSCRTAP